MVDLPPDYKGLRLQAYKGIPAKVYEIMRTVAPGTAFITTVDTSGEHSVLVLQLPDYDLDMGVMCSHCSSEVGEIIGWMNKGFHFLTVLEGLDMVAGGNPTFSFTPIKTLGVKIAKKEAIDA